MAKAKATGLSFTDEVKNTEAARKIIKTHGSSESDEEIVARPVPVVKEEIMRRGVMLFGEWPKQLCMELLEYCDQTAVLEPIRALEQEGLHQVMEFVFDLRLLGGTTKTR